MIQYAPGEEGSSDQAHLQVLSLVSNIKLCCVYSIHIENTDIEHFENQDFSVVKSF